MLLSRNKLKSIKISKYYKYFIQFLFYPVYHFFWQYFLNLNAKILYFLWKLKKKKYIPLLNNDKLLITGNKVFAQIAKKNFTRGYPTIRKFKKRNLEY